jgi:microcystin-dependent protein
LAIGSLDTGLLFVQDADDIIPFNMSTGAGRDNAIDLGQSGNRFKDVHAVTYYGDGSNLTGISSTPAGVIIHTAANSAPSGYLKANGSAVSRSTYSALFSAIGTTYGSGNGSSTFNLPDLRGEFVRGWDDGRGVDSGRGIGTTQAHATESHRHAHGTDGQRANGYNTNGKTDANGYTNTSGNQSGVGGYSNNTTSDMMAMTSTGSTPLGGAETRPRNIALLACIKY